MEIHKMKKDELKAMGLDKNLETELEIRKALHGIRMDVYGDKKLVVGKVRVLKKQLARVLTYRKLISASARS